MSVEMSDGDMMGSDVAGRHDEVIMLSEDLSLD